MGADGHLVYVDYENIREFVLALLLDMGLDKEIFNSSEDYDKFVDFIICEIAYQFRDNRIPDYATNSREDWSPSHDDDYEEITEKVYAYYDTERCSLNDFVAYLNGNDYIQTNNLWRSSNEKHPLALTEFYKTLKFDKYGITIDNLMKAFDANMHLLKLESWQMWT
jgi:hypothetical protein